MPLSCISRDLYIPFHPDRLGNTFTKRKSDSARLRHLQLNPKFLPFTSYPSLEFSEHSVPWLDDSKDLESPLQLPSLRAAFRRQIQASFYIQLYPYADNIPRHLFQRAQPEEMSHR